MSSVAAAVERLNALLSFVDADLPPLEPRRRDWTAVTSDLEAVEAELEGTLDALACIEDPDERTGLAADAAWGLARTGALLHNAGRPSGAALIRRAATMDRSDPALRFGGERPDGLLWLMFAIELRAAGQVARAETIVDDLRARHGSRDLDRVARNLGYINRFPVSLRTRRLRKRLAIAGGLALVALVGSIHYWSPAQRAQRAFDALVDQASTGSPADASGAWRAFLDGEHARVRADLREQALGHMLDSWIAQVPDSSALERVVTIETYTESYLALPDTWQIVPTRRQWLSALRGWAEQSDDPTTHKRLLACARRVLTDRPPDALRSDERKFGAIRGDLWREHTPLRALTAYTGAMEVPRARAQSAKLVSRIVARWGLVEAERLRLSQWRDHAEAHPDTAAARAALDAALEAVATATANPHRAAVLAGHDLPALHALVAADPADAGAVARLAELLARSGRTGDAERTISEAARPQWRTNEEERVLSTVLARTGRPQAAEDLLEAQITREVDLLISARARYEARLARVPEETWDDDAELAARRRDFRAASAVIDTALDLGAMKLERANSATTAGARARLLAEAERAFLSVGAAAKGQPRYHLELGSIYYRLGKGDDAEAAFDGVRALDDPSWTLDVAAAYRQLGMDARGRRVARDVYDTESGRARDDAARLLAHFADSSDDEAAWLERIATPGPATGRGSPRRERTSRSASRTLPPQPADTPKPMRCGRRGATTTRSRSTIVR